MANRADDPQYDFKAPEENRKKWTPKKWENTAFQGVSPMDFYVRQNNEKKKTKEKERQVAAAMYNYKSKGQMSGAENFAKSVNEQHEKVKQAKRDVVEDAKKVNITSTVESESRKKDFDRDQNWKATQTQTKGKLNQFDMARSLFGGGGGGGSGGGQDDEVEEPQEMLEEDQQEVHQEDPREEQNKEDE